MMISKEFATTEEHLGEVLDQLGHFRSDCAQFQTVSQDISKHRRLMSLTLARNTSLLEILELPQVRY